MGVIENIKAFFSKKDNNEVTGEAPVGVCPNCWGAQQWENEYYEFKKGHSGNYDNDTYNSFIQDVARKLGKVTAQGNEYHCQTCMMKYN